MPQQTVASKLGFEAEKSEKEKQNKLVKNGDR